MVTRMTRTRVGTTTRTRVEPAGAAPASTTLAAVRRRTRSTEQPQDKPPKAVKPATDLIAHLPDDFKPVEPIFSRVREQPRHTRPGNHLHVSDLLHKCIRKRALHDLHGVKSRPQILSLNDVFTFGQGDAIHDIAKKLIGEGAPGSLWGKWSCKCGSLKHDDPCTLEEIEVEECPHCLTQVDTYHEVPMFDDELNIVGNPDVLLWLEEFEAMHIVELKSKADKLWKEMTRPDPDHVLQVVFYWYLMNKLGYRLTDKVSIVYITKGWQFGSTRPYKEYVLDAQPELARIKDMIKDAKSYKKMGITKKLPVRTHCSTEESKDAKTCEVCQLCFASE